MNTITVHTATPSTIDVFSFIGTPNKAYNQVEPIIRFGDDTIIFQVLNTSSEPWGATARIYFLTQELATAHVTAMKATVGTRLTITLDNGLAFTPVYFYKVSEDIRQGSYSFAGVTYPLAVTYSIIGMSDNNTTGVDP